VWLTFGLATGPSNGVSKHGVLQFGFLQASIWLLTSFNLASCKEAAGAAMSDGVAPDGETGGSTINIPTADAERDSQEGKE